MKGSQGYIKNNNSGSRYDGMPFGVTAASGLARLMAGMYALPGAMNGVPPFRVTAAFRSVRFRAGYACFAGSHGSRNVLPEFLLSPRLIAGVYTLPGAMNSGTSSGF